MSKRRPTDAVSGLTQTRRSMGDGTLKGRSRISTPYDPRRLKRPGALVTPRMSGSRPATILLVADDVAIPSGEPTTITFAEDPVLIHLVEWDGPSDELTWPWTGTIMLYVEGAWDDIDPGDAVVEIMIGDRIVWNVRAASLADGIVLVLDVEDVEIPNATNVDVEFTSAEVQARINWSGPSDEIVWPMPGVVQLWLDGELTGDDGSVVVLVDNESGWTLLPNVATGNGGSEALRGTSQIEGTDTSVVVAHGLPRAPEPGEVQLLPRTIAHDVVRYRIHTEGVSEFTVEVDPAPGTGNTFAFGWLWVPAAAAPLPPAPESSPLIEAMASPLGTLSAGFVQGWRFTVGSSALTAVELRIYFPQTVQREVRLWKDDGTLLRSVTIDAVTDEWAVGAIDAVTLDANEDYAVTVSNQSGNSYSYSSPSAFTFNPAITFISSRWLSTSDENAFPTSTSDDIYGIVDVGVT